LNEKISVIGAGTMGHGIAQIAAMSGFQVWIYDIKEEILFNAIEKIKQSLEKFKAKGVISDINEVLSRINKTTSLEDALKNSNYMIEAVPEILDIKLQIFKKAESIIPDAEFFGTNTSSLPISEISRELTLKEKVVGIHFFNPPQLMKLVEIIKGNYTSEETLNKAVIFGKRLNKVPVIVKKDVPGFIVNRLLARLMNASCQIVENNVANIVEIDSALKYKLGFPMGVFELADYSGIDVFYLVFRAMNERGFLGDFCKTFEKMYEEGKFGVKTGEGFYKYPGKGIYKKPDIPAEAGSKFDPWLVVSPEVGEALWLIKNDIASESDINTASMLGLGYPKGIVQMGNEFGLTNVKDRLKKLAEITGKKEYDYLLQYFE